MPKKTCAHCKISKEQRIENFRYIAKPTRGKPRWGEVCRICVAVYNKKYREAKREELKQKKKDHYENNKEEYKARGKAYRNNNKEKIAASKKEWKKKKLKEDPQFWLRERLSCSIHIALKKRKHSKGGVSMADFLPYTIPELKAHIESLFEDWMTWENHGNYRPETWDDNDKSTWVWHIDHIIPQSKFKYTSMKQDSFKECWALSNLRPLSGKKNVTEQHLR